MNATHDAYERFRAKWARRGINALAKECAVRIVAAALMLRLCLWVYEISTMVAPPTISLLAISLFLALALEALVPRAIFCVVLAGERLGELAWEDMFGDDSDDE